MIKRGFVKPSNSAMHRLDFRHLLRRIHHDESGSISVVTVFAFIFLTMVMGMLMMAVMVVVEIVLTEMVVRVLTESLHR